MSLFPSRFSYMFNDTLHSAVATPSVAGSRPRMKRGAAPEVVHLFIMALLWLSLHPLTGPSSRLARAPRCPLSSPLTMSANLHMLQELVVRFRQLSSNLIFRIFSRPNLKNQFLTIYRCCWSPDVAYPHTFVYNFRLHTYKLYQSYVYCRL